MKTSKEIADQILKYRDKPKKMANKIRAMGHRAGLDDAAILRAVTTGRPPSFDDVTQRSAIGGPYVTRPEREREEQFIEAQKNAVFELREFLSKPFKMQRPQESIFHKMIECGDRSGFTHLQKNWKKGIEFESETFWPTIKKEAKVFVVNHDWASVFANVANAETGDYELPFEVCAFEFVISNHRIVCLTGRDGRTGVSYLMFFFQHKLGWMCLGPYERNVEGQYVPMQQEFSPGYESEFVGLKAIPVLNLTKISDYIADHIRAICIMLDAEVAVIDIKRTPHKLNQARLERGRPPLLDYHIVSLTRRTRPATLPASDAEPGSRKRLHFRRGHWRHFPGFRTWIKWQLVGSPDLGFIDKEYKL